VRKLKSLLDPQLLTKDLLASFVVFLVALPLCMGIALASGVPPALGLVTGMVGGIVVGSISGSPFQVSGPAAGLAVVVAELVRDHGIEMVGPVLMLAGLIQLLAGRFKLGQLFRAMSPAVIYGMLSGIGVLILASQLHVMIDDKPRIHGIDNLLSIPEAFYKAFVSVSDANHHLAAAIGFLSIVTLVAWDKFKPEKLRLVPGALVAVVLATLIASILKLQISYVDVPANLLETIRLPQLSSFFNVIRAPMLLQAITIAFIASAESLLSAVAVDRMHQGPRANFDQELSAQGIGNLICGALGTVPMTGVIVRSSVNVEAGAKTRVSAILHGVWLIVLVVAAPNLLRMVPTASLAAILVVTGYRLIEVEHIRHLKRYGRIPLIIFFATFITIVITELLTGILIGIVLTAVFVISKVSNLKIRVEHDERTQRIDIHLEGAATFVRLPELASALERIPPKTQLYVHLEKLAYVDHTCFDLLSNWASQQEGRGSTITVEWEGLTDRYRRPFATRTNPVSFPASGPFAEEF
jgi:MFS superfamily sulfate permease-like transporter